MKQNWLKRIAVCMLLACICFTFFGCGTAGQNADSPEVSNLGAYAEIPNGTYIILDVRESQGFYPFDLNLKTYNFYLSFVLENTDHNRFYYSYSYKSKKNNPHQDKSYIQLAKFVAGDKVQYANGYFTLIQENFSK